MFAKDYRALARKHLRGNTGTAIAACLIVAFLSGLVGLIPGVGTIASLLITGPLTFGLVGIFLSLARTQKANLNTLFEAFTSCFLNTFLASLLQGLFVFLWSLLFVIPGIVKGYSYAMTFYILNDHPELSANEAITRSREMMRGHKWQLFCLHFSFIGWILLSCLTFGILMIWILPYMSQADAEFYENIKGKQTTSTQAEAPQELNA